MKILVPITYAELGGSQVFLLKLQRAFSQDENVHFHVLLFRQGPLCEELTRRNIPHDVIEYTMNKPWTILPVIRKIRQENPDVIYLHAGRFFAALAWFMGIPCVERINMSRVADVGGWCSTPWIDRICTSLNTKALAVSSAIACQLTERGVPDEKIIVIRNFVEVERFHHPENRVSAKKLLGVPDNVKLVINVGRFTPQKAQRDFIDTAVKVLKRDPDFLFLLIGDGPLKQDLQQQIEREGIGKNVRFMNFRKDVEIVYHAADFMLHTAHWAPLDNVLLEAMAAELPVIASDVDGTSEVIQDGTTGLLFKAGDTEKAASLLLKVASNTDFAAKLGKNAFELIRKNHSIPQVTSQFRRMFADLSEMKK